MPTKPEGLPNPAAFLDEMYANSAPLPEPSDYDGGHFYGNDVPDAEGDGSGDVVALRSEVAALRASADRLAESVGIRRLRQEFLRFVEGMEKGLAGNAAKGGRR
ncbi:hypothetical protein [Azospirillum brasilense]|uniref:hypothetical protein n=1 Tax=Azospirillum brasilense TaxID=192 RepID=UPI001478F1DE|nr:hypothetical protein [Azospirillum brasilense]